MGHPLNDPRSLVNGILWVLHTGILGVISLNATARGKPSSAASMPGARTALGAVSSPRCWTNWTTKAGSTTTSSASTAPSFARAELLPGREKKPTVPNRLGGRKSAQTEEPSDYALGRSRGGFGTKVHLVCDRKGFILALRITAGQVHESKAFEGTMARRLIPDRRGRRRWPDRLAADKGYSYPRIRIWCNKRRIKAMIPIREARSQLPCLVVSRHHGSGPQTPIAKQTLE